MALDRAGISRGYASNHRFVPNGWDCPVVLAAHRPELTNHGNEFHNGSRKKYCRVENFKIPIAELGLVHVTIHKFVFYNYQQLPQRWERLEGPNAQEVLCRTRLGIPNDFYSAGRGIVSPIESPGSILPRYGETHPPPSLVRLLSAFMELFIITVSAPGTGRIPYYHRTLFQYLSEMISFRILELDFGTFKIESGACDLPPEGSKKKSLNRCSQNFIDFIRIS